MNARRVLTGVLVGILVLGVGISGGYFWPVLVGCSDNLGPGEVVVRYIDIIDGNDPIRAYSLFSPSAKEEVSEEEFVALITLSKMNGGIHSSIVVDRVQMVNNTASVHLRFTVTSAKTGKVVLGYDNVKDVWRLVKINGEWFIDHFFK